MTTTIAQTPATPVVPATDESAGMTTRTAPDRSDESGFALVFVLIGGLAMIGIIAVMVNFLGGEVRETARFQADAAALPAAEAGVDDYLFRLNGNSNYFNISDPDNDAVDGWQQVSGGDGRFVGEYHYNVDSSTVLRDGFVRLSVTGRVDDELRTVETQLRRDGFLDFIYLTEYEIIDPVLSYNFNDPTVEQWTVEQCRHYHYETWRADDTFVVPGYYDFGGGGSDVRRVADLTVGDMGTITGLDWDVNDFYASIYRAGQDRYPGNSNSVYNNLAFWTYTRNFDDTDNVPDGCDDIRFVGADTLEGPVHSQDSIRVDGSTNFLGSFSTLWPGTNPGGQTDDPGGANYNRLWRYPPGGPATQPNFASPPEANVSVPFPDYYDLVIEQTTPATGGCRYFGPTYVILDGDRMHVHSPASTAGHPDYSATIPGNFCGTGQNLPLPANGVLYVEDYNNDNTSAYNCVTGNHAILGSSQRHPDDNVSHPARPVYEKCKGDVFIWGELDGQMTVAAKNNVIILSDLTYAGNPTTGDDLLGLVGTRYVQIYRPIRSCSSGSGCGSGAYALPIGTRYNSNTLVRPFSIFPLILPDDHDERNGDIEIFAAVVALQNSIYVENWGYGARDLLSVRGALSQSFRGAVGQGGVRGYDKDYVHDDRLRFISPPYFIEPIASAWRQRTWTEVQPPPYCTSGQSPQADACLPA